MKKARTKAIRPSPLAPNTAVDAPYPFQASRYGPEFPGYIVRWRARREFLDKAVDLIPDLLPSLVTTEAIQLASEPAFYTEIAYPTDLHLHAPVLENALFSRKDRLFDGVDWTDFDPRSDDRITRLTVGQQRLTRWLGRDGISSFWQARTETRIDLHLPVWTAVTMWSRSESEGEGESEQLRNISPGLWYHINEWAARWQLNHPWVFLVAMATVREAAKETSASGPLPTGFVFPKSWEDWYYQNMGTLGGPRPVKRPQRRIGRGDHMSWLIQRHFMKRSTVEIAKMESRRSGTRLTQQAVDKQTKRLARLVVLTLDPNRGGHPRKRARTVRYHHRN